MEIRVDDTLLVALIVCVCVKRSYEKCLGVENDECEQRWKHENVGMLRWCEKPLLASFKGIFHFVALKYY